MTPGGLSSKRCVLLAVFLVAGSSLAAETGSTAVFTDAIAAARAGEHERAVRLYSRYLVDEAQPADRLAYAYHNRANSLRALDRSEPALRDYAKAVELLPDFFYARYARATLLQQLGRYAQAIAEYDAVLAADPKADYAYYNRAHCYHLSGAYGRAVDDFSTVIERQPDHALAVLGRANAFNALGRRREAVQDYREALRLAPEDPVIRARLRELGLIGAD